MDARLCQDQSAECLRLMRSAQLEREARVLKDISASWARLAGQIDRYNVLVRQQGPSSDAVERRSGVAT
jgi:hypothetical protein